MFFIGLLYFAFIIALLVANWKIYEKAKQPGWAAIVPIYNIYVLLKIVGKPTWWLVLYLIPVVNVVFAIWTLNMLSKSFGKNEGTTVLFFVLGIGYLILGFGDAQYQGPYGDPVAFRAYRDGQTTFDFERPSV